MKIALLGNMNNNAINLARFLIDRGINCDVLFFENEADHFQPSADDLEVCSYKSVSLEWGGYKKYFTTSRKTIRRDVEDYDFLIGSRLAPAYLDKAGIKLDIFMPTGGDLHSLPVWNGWNSRDLLKYLGFSGIQRRAIEKVGALYWDFTNPEVERTIAPYTNHLRRIVHGIPTIYYPDFEGTQLERRKARSTWLQRFTDARRDADVYLISHVKHVWTPAVVAHYGRFHEKGNDQIILALAKYYERSRSTRIRIAMFEYGDDHLNTRMLAKKLGVDRHIDWFPQMPRKEIMLGIEVADGVIGEITQSYLTYGTVVEAMAMNRAVLHHRNDEFYPGKPLYPMLNTPDAESLARAFEKIDSGKVNLAQMGEASGAWLREYGVGAAIDAITAQIGSSN